MRRLIGVLAAAALCVGALAAAEIWTTAGSGDALVTNVGSAAVSSFGLGGNGDWGLPYTPTEDCVGEQFTGGSTWACTGITMTKAGSPTAGRPTAFWPNGFGGTNAVSTEFTAAGTDFFYATAQAPHHLRSVCVEFHAHSVSGVQSIWGQDDLADQRHYTLLLNAGVLEWCVFKDPTHYSTLTIGTVTSAPFAWNTACFSYDDTGGDGAAVMRGALNGIASTPVTTGVAPPYTGEYDGGTAAAELMFGARGTHLASQDGFGGDIRRVTRWTDRALTQAEMVTATRYSMGAIGSGGEEITFTRASATTCEQNGVISTLGNNYPCVTENGLQRFSGATHVQLYSEQFQQAGTWVAEAGVTVDDDSADCPMSPNGVDRMDLVSGLAATPAGIYQCPAAGTAATMQQRWVWMATRTGDADCTIVMLDGCGGSGGGARSVTATPTLFNANGNSGAAGQRGQYFYAGTCTRACFWGADIYESPTQLPYATTTNASVTVNEDAPTLANNGLVVDAQGAVCATVRLPSVWASSTGAVIGMTGAGGTPMFVDSATFVSVYDAVNVTAAAVTDMRTGSRRICTAWDSGAGKMLSWERGGTLNSANYDGTIGGGALINIGTSPGLVGSLNGWIKNLSFCRGGGWDKNAAGACQ